MRRFDRSATAPVIVPATTSAPPALSAVSQSASRWREGKLLATLSRKRRAPLGTTFSFTLSEAASVTLSFSHQVVGRRVKRHGCLALTPRNRHRPSCKRTVIAGTVTLAGHAGLDRIAFQGKLSATRELARGSYTVTTRATNSAGMRSTPAVLHFTIVK